MQFATFLAKEEALSLFVGMDFPCSEEIKRLFSILVVEEKYNKIKVSKIFTEEEFEVDSGETFVYYFVLPDGKRHGNYFAISSGGIVKRRCVYKDGKKIGLQMTSLEANYGDECNSLEILENFKDGVREGESYCDRKFLFKRCPSQTEKTWKTFYNFKKGILEGTKIRNSMTCESDSEIENCIYNEKEYTVYEKGEVVCSWMRWEENCIRKQKIFSDKFHTLVYEDGFLSVYDRKTPSGPFLKIRKVFEKDGTFSTFRVSASDVWSDSYTTKYFE